jgi:hypothetical protein
MEDWDASVEEDLLAAHELLMRGLVDEMGERTQPDSSRSPTQRYRLTRKGLRCLQHHADE